MVLVLASTALLSKSLVPAAVTFIKLRFSDELFQTAIIGYCMTCAWICGRLGLSHELGAFLAGIMLSSFEHHHSVLHSTEQVRPRRRLRFAAVAAAAWPCRVACR